MSYNEVSRATQVSDSPLVSQFSDRYNQRRITIKDPLKLTLRHRYVVELHLCGHTAESISEITNYSMGRVYEILHSDAAVHHKQEMMKAYDDEFQALYQKTISAVRSGLDALDPDTKLKAAQIWLKAHGKFESKQQTVVNVTAEDVVLQLIQGQDGMQVNGRQAADVVGHKRDNDVVGHSNRFGSNNQQPEDFEDAEVQEAGC